MADGHLPAGGTRPDALRLAIVTSEGVYHEPLWTLERVRDALLECGAVGIRRTFKPEWRLHFPLANASRLKMANVGKSSPINTRGPS
jgi:hypothetical protein